MSNVRSMMINRTTIERDASGSDDVLGAKEKPNWLPTHADQACFLVGFKPRFSGEELIQPSMGTAVTKMAVYLPLGLDVTPKDRLNGIRDRQGTDILTGFFNIVLVIPHHNHLELLIEKAGP
jgi:hypothetical protein